MVKKKLDENQLLVRRRNKIILDSEIVDTRIEIDQNQYMIDNKVAEKRLRKQLVIAKSKLDNLEQNLTICEKELRTGQLEFDPPIQE